LDWTGTSVLEGSPEFSEAYLNVIRQLIFEPTMLDGEPVEVDVTLETGFARQTQRSVIADGTGDGTGVRRLVAFFNVGE
jgi:hypothetical protein